MTPCQLEVLLHLYTTPVEHPRAHAPAVKEAIAIWVDEGIVKYDDMPRGCADHGFVFTERGECFLKEILATPLPTAICPDVELGSKYPLTEDGRGV